MSPEPGRIPPIVVGDGVEDYRPRESSFPPFATTAAPPPSSPFGLDRRPSSPLIDLLRHACSEEFLRDKRDIPPRRASSPPRNVEDRDDGNNDPRRRLPKATGGGGGGSNEPSRPRPRLITHLREAGAAEFAASAGADGGGGVGWRRAAAAPTKSSALKRQIARSAADDAARLGELERMREVAMTRSAPTTPRPKPKPKTRRAKGGATFPDAAGRRGGISSETAEATGGGGGGGGSDESRLGRLMTHLREAGSARFTASGGGGGAAAAAPTPSSSALKRQIVRLAADDAARLAELERMREAAMTRSAATEEAAAATPKPTTTTKQRQRTRGAADFLDACRRDGISPDLAEEARREASDARRKWWSGGYGEDGAARGRRTAGGGASTSKEGSGAEKGGPAGGGGGGGSGAGGSVRKDGPEAAAAATAGRFVPPPAASIPPALVDSADALRRSAKDAVASSLRNSYGEVTNPAFVSALKVLSAVYSAAKLGRGGEDCDARGMSPDLSRSVLEGTRRILSRPNYPDCLGRNVDGEFVYALGRMSFDMFRPGHLPCSIQGIRSEIGPVEELPASIPRKLRETVERGLSKLRSYNIIVDMTIEPEDEYENALGRRPEEERGRLPSSRLRATMTTRGYMFPDPDTPDRFTVWFTGGTLAPAAAAASGDPSAGPPGEWSALFGNADGGGGPPRHRRTMGERARALAARMFLGADSPGTMKEDGSMSYELHRPIGGHGKTYVDVLYLDEDLRILRGNAGTIFVQAREGFVVPPPPVRNGVPAIVRPRAARRAVEA